MGDDRGSTPSLVTALRKSQVLQRLQLELTLDTIPRDSCYSAHLIDLMKREELALRDSPNSAATKELLLRVDDALRIETQKFFSKSVSQNVKKWTALLKKMEQEIERLGAGSKTSATKEQPTQEAAPIEVGGPRYRIPTPEELDRETHRLSCDYNENWAKYEEHNLSSAFLSQIARVENDWMTQELSLTDEFNTRKAQLLGTSAGALESPSKQHANADRWQHPEKQKTLIHTAPVMSPTISRASKDETTSPDLERLQRQFRAAIENLEKQKAAAIRWMGRQEIRLMAQSKETAQERSMIASIIKVEMSY